MIDIVDELRCIDRFGRAQNRILSYPAGHPVCQRAADEIQRLRVVFVDRDGAYVPEAAKSGVANWRAGLDDLSRELLSILANIQTAATMSAVLVNDPEEQAAWEAVRDKAAEGAQAYRKAKYPPATDQQAD
jgi:hypothetical protein